MNEQERLQGEVNALLSHVTFHQEKCKQLELQNALLVSTLVDEIGYENTYWAIKDFMDTEGWITLQEAKKLLGDDSIGSHYPYEDNHGVFDEMDGNELREWLEAIHFADITWEPVGDTYERAAEIRMVVDDKYTAYKNQLFECVVKTFCNQNKEDM